MKKTADIADIKEKQSDNGQLKDKQFMLSKSRPEVGFVTKINDFLITLNGMPTVKINEMVVSGSGRRGWVTSLGRDELQVLLLDEGAIASGEMFSRRQEGLSVPAGLFLLGRAVNPLGVPIDGRGPLAVTKTDKPVSVAGSPRPMHERENINRQFYTGMSLIDTLIPVGCGQRELVLGDARSGKTEFFINVIANQKTTGVICIYASIGKPIADVKSLLGLLAESDSFRHTIVVGATATDPAALIFLAPQTAFALSEYFARQGKDVLLILDDLGSHARIYREISLLSNLPPGREAYPGDIFYQHASLLERAGNFNRTAGAGSITALPAIELNLNDFTTYIPTNLMSITDGHLLFRSSLYNQGLRPAVDISLSVSRVGRQTQKKLLNRLGFMIRQTLARALELETLTRFSFELPPESRLILKQRSFIREIIKQPGLSYYSPEIQILLGALIFTSWLEEKEEPFLADNKEKLIKTLETGENYQKLAGRLEEFGDIPALAAELDQLARLG